MTYHFTPIRLLVEVLYITQNTVVKFDIRCHTLQNKYLLLWDNNKIRTKVGKTLFIRVIARLLA